jgi:hypothetical protein
MILAVISKVVSRILPAIDRALALLGRRCCVARSQRQLDRAKTSVGR